MDFSLTGEQREVQRRVRDLVEEHVAPGVAERDAGGDYPAEVQRRLAEHGLYGMKAPEEYGGLDYDTISYVVALQEIARVDASMATSVAAHNSLCCGHLLLAANAEQRSRFLPRLASGEAIGAWALTERDAGSDAAGLTTRATRDGSDWVLDGEKMFITHGSVAGIYIILVTADPDRGRDGITAFVVERDTPGFSPRAPLDKMGLRTSDTAPIVLKGCRVPAANQLGEVGQGFTDALSVLDGGRVSIAAISCGLARAALESGVAYAADRKQFGKPIGQFQAIQWMLADMATELAAAQLLTFQAAAAYDCALESWDEDRAGWRNDAAGVGAVSARQAISMAKLFASEAATRAALKAVQIHGGYGYLRGVHVVERLLRDAKFFEIGEGTSEIQRLVIARELLNSAAPRP